MSEEAPGRVPLVLALLNSADLESGTDEWSTPAAFGQWLRDRDLLSSGRPTDDDLALALDLREGLRDAVHDQCGPGPGADTTRLAAALARLPVVLGADLRPSPAPGLRPVQAALAEAVAAVVEAQVAGVWDRVKVCGRDSCRWAFFDASRNRSGTWCSMRVCGNREKMRRRRTASPGS